MCRCNWHSAGSFGWSFPVLNYEYMIRLTKICRSNFVKQHLETLMVWNYQYADCCLENNFIVSCIIVFGTLSYPMVFRAEATHRKLWPTPLCLPKSLQALHTAKSTKILSFETKWKILWCSHFHTRYPISGQPTTFRYLSLVLKPCQTHVTRRNTSSRFIVFVCCWVCVYYSCVGIENDFGSRTM